MHTEALATIPAAHLAFLDGLPFFHRTAECFLVHAGVRPGVPLAAQAEADMIWIRRAFLDDPREHGALIVHGHTPVDHVTHLGNRLAIDTGAGFGGPVSAVALEGRRAFLLTDTGRLPIEPQA